MKRPIPHVCLYFNLLIIHSHQSARAVSYEADDQRHIVIAGKIRFKCGERFFELAVLTEENFIGAFDVPAALFRESMAFKADFVNIRDAHRFGTGKREGENVLGDIRSRLDECIIAHMGKLMERADPADGDMVADFDMTGHGE